MAKRNFDTGQNAVLAFMQKHPGIVFTGETLADELQMARPYAVPLGASMNRLVKKGLIERVAMGKYLYRKTPAPAAVPAPVHNPATGTVYESIGIRKSTGNVIVTDVDNNLYELHEL